ncbi:TAXI family TRAP transporter solute-binding subunit [Bacillus tianshenii]|nr:TAXI family TRAP transporter solute-binding subunit [Bacillus tianshenii]
MKIKRNFLFVLLLALSMVMAACGGQQASPAPDNEEGAEEQQQGTQNLTIATGGTTGTYFPVGTAIGQAMSKSDQFKVTAQSTGGSIANLRMIKQGEVELILSAANTGFAGYKGEDPFKEPIENIRAIAGLYPETFQFIVKKDSGMKTIDDLKGKRVAVGSPGSGTERTGKLMLEAHGITYDDIKPEFLGFGEAVTALKDGGIDAAIIGSGVPTAAVVDASSSMEIDLLNVDKEKFESFIEDEPFVITNTIPAGTYEGVDYEVTTAASPAMLLTSTEMDEEAIYNLTKTMFENINVIQEAHVQGKNISLDTALKGISIPLHPGAEKYYKEEGKDVSGIGQ